MTGLGVGPSLHTGHPRKLNDPREPSPARAERASPALQDRSVTIPAVGIGVTRVVADRFPGSFLRSRLIFNHRSGPRSAPQTSPPLFVSAATQAYQVPETGKQIKSGENLGDAYLNANRPVVRRRLYQCGVRLAMVLNETWPED
jgi:S1/P1 Nuclease